MRLKVLAVATLFTLGAIPVYAAGKNCDELKMEIAMKIEANGVKSYDLTIVKNDDVKSGDNVVGSCEGGTKKIVYVRQSAETAPKTPGK